VIVPISQFGFESGNAFANDARLLLGTSRIIEQRTGQSLANMGAEAVYKLLRIVALMIEREAHAQSEFGIVLKQRVAPSRPSALSVLRVRRRRQIAAIDTRAPRGVGDDRTVAE